MSRLLYFLKHISFAVLLCTIGIIFFPNSASAQFKKSSQLHFNNDADDNTGNGFGFSIAYSGDATKLFIGAESGINATYTFGAFGTVHYASGSGKSMYMDEVDLHLSPYHPTIANPIFLRLGHALAASDNGFFATSSEYVIDLFTDQNHPVRVFITQSGSTNNISSTITAPTTGDAFGNALALSSDAGKVLIGAPNFSESSSGPTFLNAPGKAYVYSGSPHHSNYSSIITLNGTENGDRFGSAVAMAKDASRLVVGAYNTASGRGSVFIYDGSGTLITQLDGSAAGDQFGRSVHTSNDGSVVAIGAPGKNGKGSVSVYKEINGVYELQTTNMNGVSNNDNFGKIVKLSGDGTVLAVAAPGNGGKVFSYKVRGDFWQTISVNLPTGNGFAKAIDLSNDGNYLAISSPGYDRNSIGYVSFYEYEEPVPVITSVFPTSGAAGTSVRVGISRFPDAQIFLRKGANKYAMPVDSSNATTIYAKVPEGISGGKYQLESSLANKPEGTIFTVVSDGGAFMQDATAFGPSSDNTLITNYVEAYVPNKTEDNIETPSFAYLLTGTLSGTYDIPGEEAGTGTGNSGFKINGFYSSGHSYTRVAEDFDTPIEAIAVGDLTGDGLMNVLLGGDNFYYLNERSSENLFGRHYPYTQSLISNGVGTISDLKIADIPGNGGTHVVVADRDNNKISWFTNTIGNLTDEIVISSNSTGVSSVEVVDIDQDGNLDIIAASKGDNTLAWFENVNGDGTSWIKHVISSELTGVQKLAVADFDGDGFLDVAITQPDIHTVGWLRNLGNGQFSAFQLLSNEVTNTPGIVAADLNGDGRPEIAAAYKIPTGATYTPSFVWFPNVSKISTSKTFATKRVKSRKFIELESLNGIYASDVNNDGKIDIVTTRTEGSDRLRVHYNSTPEPYVLVDDFFPKSGTEGTKLTIYGEGFGGQIQDVSVDIDGVSLNIESVVNTQIKAVLPANIAPGYHQISVTNTANEKQKSSMGYFSYTNPGGMFTPKQLLVSGSHKQLLYRKDRLYYESAAGGINIFENGQSTAAIPEVNVAGKLILKQNAGEYLNFWLENGTQSRPVIYKDNGTAPFEEKIDGNANPYNGKAVTKADINQSGIADIIFANQTSLMIRAYRATGETTFWGDLPVPIIELSQFGEPVEALASGDIDNDGYIDILILGNTKVAWLKNTVSTGGELVYQGDIITGLTNAKDIELADFTNNNRPDIAILDKGTEQIKVYSNNGNATFSSTPQQFGPGGGQSSITTFNIADVDGRGNQDIVLASGNSVYVYKNGSEGISNTAELITTANNPILNLEPGDHNGDGQTDLFYSETSGIYLVLNSAGDPVVQHSPANSAQNQSLQPTLSWNALPDINSYIVQISEQSDFSTILINETVSGTTSFQPENNLVFGKNYFWRVRGINENISPSLEMPWSETWNLRIQLMENGEGTVESPYLISTIEELDRVRFGLSNHFELQADLDLGPHTSVNNGQFWNDGLGWNPIGSEATPFAGSFNGKGHTISNLFINQPSNTKVGLFGVISEANIQKVRLENVAITGSAYVGGIIGEVISNSTLSELSVSGSVSAVSADTYDVGGISSRILNSSLHRSFSEAIISGDKSVGGLLGRVEDNATVTESWASGNVSGKQHVGGLVGYNSGTISNSYATGNVSGTEGDIGGLVGNPHTGTVSKSYAAGTVTLTNAGSSDVGGLAGNSDGTVTQSFWNEQTSGQNDTNAEDGMQGVSTLSMHTKETFTEASWDFSSIWSIRKDTLVSYPYLTNNVKDFPGINALPRLSAELTGPTPGWRMIGSPGSSARYSDVLRTVWTQGFTGASNNEQAGSNVYFYDEPTRNWVKPSHANNFYGTNDAENGSSAGKAAIVFLYESGFPGSIDMAGYQNQSEVVINLSNTVATPDDQAQGYHLVSNPYPFSIDWKKVVADGLNEVSPAIFIYDANTLDGAGGYRVHYGFDIPSLPGTINHSGILAPFQGFWVRTSQMDGTPGTLTFKPSHAATEDGTLYKGTEEKEETSAEKEFIALSLTNEKQNLALSAVMQFSDDTLSVSLPQALSETTTLFGWMDSTKSVYSIKNSSLDVFEKQSTSLGFSSSLTDNFTIELNEVSLKNNKQVELWIVDQETNERHQLNEKTPFLFEHTSESKSNGKSLAEKSSPEFSLGQKTTSVEEAKPRFSIEVLITTPIEEEAELPEEFALFQNYPNPFNPSTTISYSLPEAGHVVLEIYDINGRMVSSVLNEQKSAGNHSVTFNATRLASGVYIYRLRAGGKFMAYKKFVLIK